MNTPERRGGRKHGRGNGAIGGIWTSECTKAKKREEGGRDWLVGAIPVQQIKRRRSKRSCTFASGQTGLAQGPQAQSALRTLRGNVRKGAQASSSVAVPQESRRPRRPRRPQRPRQGRREGERARKAWTAVHLQRAAPWIVGADGAERSW
jgi:hypothetical protein